MQNNNCFEYRGCKTNIEFSIEDNLFFGKIEERKINDEYVKVSDLILFDGKDMNEVYNSFREAVDDYFEILKEINRGDS